MSAACLKVVPQNMLGRGGHRLETIFVGCSLFAYIWKLPTYKAMEFFTDNCVWELLCLQLEALFCLQLELLCLQWELFCLQGASNKHIDGLQAKNLNRK